MFTQLLGRVDTVYKTVDLAEFCVPGPLMTGGWESDLR
jgi:hypothetical protein